MSQLPAISGNDLIALLQKDGWIIRKQMKHGLSLTKEFPDRTRRRTTVKKTSESLPNSTLSAILGPLQTNIGRGGLLELLDKYS